eukprot:TRINITY_DN8219_c1_g1_i2.p1 TRINITY_DN8219_c1_g1~~TRINITY_DN8219_c1_g1_i2.p1  ORF type:complete len:676 (-),score=180.56 TRINITY_DN8219_c1_g1_i2:10-2037(-)
MSFNVFVFVFLLVSVSEGYRNATKPLSICFITIELAGIHQSGGIGTTMLGLANALRQRGHTIHIIWGSPDFSENSLIYWQEYYQTHYGFNFWMVEEAETALSPASTSSVHLFEWMKLNEGMCDYIQTHDYMASAYWLIVAQRLGLAFQNIPIQPVLHGPLFWALDASKSYIINPEIPSVRWMEKRFIQLSSVVGSPSQFLVDYMDEKGFGYSSDAIVKVIPNIPPIDMPDDIGWKGNRTINEIIFFSRFAIRKGFDIFLDAIDRFVDHDAASKIDRVICIGIVGDHFTKKYIESRAKDWPFKMELILNKNSTWVFNYLRKKSSAVVVLASPTENSPTVVLEAVFSGSCVAFGDVGGGKEFLKKSSVNFHTFSPNAKSLFLRLLQLVQLGCPQPQLEPAVINAKQLHVQWIEEEVWKTPVPKIPNFNLKSTRVCVVVPVFDRITIVRTLESLQGQTHLNLEVVVIDDGSTNLRTLKLLETLESKFSSLNLKVVHQKKGGLSSARNTGIRTCQSAWIYNIQDGDVAAPEAISTLLQAAFVMETKVVTSWVGMWTKDPQLYDFLWCPIGGSVSSNLLFNIAGTASLLMKKSVIEELGMYDIMSPGYEDWQFYVRAILNNYEITVVPQPLLMHRNIREDNKFQSNAFVIEAYMKELKLPKELRSILYYIHHSKFPLPRD